MIDYVVKPYLNGKINYVNEKSSENTEADLKIRYFKLLFIGLHSILTQKKNWRTLQKILRKSENLIGFYK